MQCFRTINVGSQEYEYDADKKTRIQSNCSTWGGLNIACVQDHLAQSIIEKYEERARRVLFSDQKSKSLG